MNGELKPVIGFLNDRVMVSAFKDPSLREELKLYVNGNGNVVALTDAQVAQYMQLFGQPTPQPDLQPVAAGPTGPTGTPEPQTKGLNGPSQPSPYEQPKLEGLEYQQTS